MMRQEKQLSWWIFILEGQWYFSTVLSSLVRQNTSKGIILSRADERTNLWITISGVENKSANVDCLKDAVGDHFAAEPEVASM